MDIKPKEEEISELLKSEKLVFKEMFYGEKVSQQVSELNKFIEPACFKQIQERMKEKGFRNGFACLFYGAPGTGKTETVYQLSRRTGRDILLVDVPQIKSKWVGDSEKNVKALFERYKEGEFNLQMLSSFINIIL
jgi:SpoVK/Ycf46/Vps4 family AAA+-type ATPase